MFLLRPAEEFPESRVVDVLGNLADRGVKVYVRLYKELEVSLTINSSHSRTALLERNPNIKVIRHPSMSIRGGIFLWSHHEKLVVVDGKIAFLGGLDLCYGRYDDATHNLIDSESPYIWNNLDYSNPRECDFAGVENWFEDPNIERNSIPRMPWHDIAMSVRGEVVNDLISHFKDQWNHCVRDITGTREQRMIIPLEEGRPQSENSGKLQLPHILAEALRRSLQQEHRDEAQSIQSLALEEQRELDKFRTERLPAFL